MGNKKNKALERELLDDLLEDQSVIDPLPPKQTKSDVSKENQGTALPADKSTVGHATTVAHPDFSKGYPAVQSKDKEKDSRERDRDNAKADRTIAIQNAIVDDKTIRLPTASIEISPDALTGGPGRTEVLPDNLEVRASVGRVGVLRGNLSQSGAALAQSENLRIAQNRILELEHEVERLRLENEDLAAAGETFRRKSDELMSRGDDLENRLQNSISTFEQEKALLLEAKDSMRDEMEQLRSRNEELELRISTNIQKIRVRERELENRLELVKMEGTAMVRSKDELILDLKRQIDQLNMELNNYRNKSQELNRVILAKQDILRRTVKALRLALTMLEGDEEATVNKTVPQKKAK